MKRPELQRSSQGLSDMPETVLHAVFSMLSAKDLAALSVQDTYLRAVASDAGLWQPLALGRWPGAEPACTQHYAGDWHALYMARAAMPHGFPLAADRVHAVTSAQRAQRQREQASGGSSVQGGLPALAFEDVMRQVFSAGLACASSRAVRQAPEWRGLKADLAWWAAERPEVVVAFIRGAHDALAGWGAGASGRSWADTPWRRSAVAFLQDLGLLSGAHASVANRVAAEAAALDGAIRSVHKVAGAAAAAPEGVPASHWWFS